MKKSRLAVALGTVALAVSATLAGCSASVVAPVTKDISSLQSQSVLLPINTVLNLNTGSNPVDSYTATISDPSVVEFTPGKVENGTTFNPGFKPLKIGSAVIEMTSDDSSDAPLKFTIQVVGAR